MKSQEKRGILLTVRDGYLICPRCLVNKKLCRVDRDTTAHNLTVFCRHCKMELKVDIEMGQCFESRSQ